MYNKQVVDYAELLLKHKQTQQNTLEQSKQQTPTISVIEDEQGVCYSVNSDVNSDGDGND